MMDTLGNPSGTTMITLDIDFLDFHFLGFDSRDFDFLSYCAKCQSLKFIDTVLIHKSTLYSRWSLCSQGSPCIIGEGDCDGDAECVGSLLCGNDNCASGPTGMDCCAARYVCNIVFVFFIICSTMNEITSILNLLDARQIVTA